MSDTELHFGKLRKVNLQNKTIEEWCKNKLYEIGITEFDEDRYSCWHEAFINESTFDNKFFFVNDTTVWEAFEHTKQEHDYINYLHTNNDGTVSFVMAFYNGGTCLSECIEDSLKSIILK